MMSSFLSVLLGEAYHTIHLQHVGTPLGSRHQEQSSTGTSSGGLPARIMYCRSIGSLAWTKADNPLAMRRECLMVSKQAGNNVRRGAHVLGKSMNNLAIGQLSLANV